MSGAEILSGKFLAKIHDLEDFKVWLGEVGFVTFSLENMRSLPSLFITAPKKEIADSATGVESPKDVHRKVYCEFHGIRCCFQMCP